MSDDINKLVEAIGRRTGCSSVTIARYLSGVRVYGATTMRIEEALRKLKRLDLIRAPEPVRDP